MVGGGNGMVYAAGVACPVVGEEEVVDAHGE